MEWLYKENNISMVTIKNFDKLCLMEVHDLSPEDIKNIRKNNM
ncbi:MAG TPA: hypothetical protein PKD00_00870 [Burkholderiales bacterium]|nr:hypothetical protein [Burkholderiales bacterium]